MKVQEIKFKNRLNCSRKKWKTIVVLKMVNRNANKWLLADGIGSPGCRWPCQKSTNCAEMLNWSTQLVLLLLLLLLVQSLMHTVMAIYLSETIADRRSSVQTAESERGKERKRRNEKRRQWWLIGTHANGQHQWTRTAHHCQRMQICSIGSLFLRRRWSLWRRRCSLGVSD